MSRSADSAHAAMPPYRPPSERLPRRRDVAAPPHALTRVLFCRSCGVDTGIRGAHFCDACRPWRVSYDRLLAPADFARILQARNLVPCDCDAFGPEPLTHCLEDPGCLHGLHLESVVVRELNETREEFRRRTDSVRAQLYVDRTEERAGKRMLP